MTKLKLQPAFAFCFKENLKSVGIFIAIMLAIYLIFSISAITFTTNGSTVGTFSAFEIAAAITIFIIGIDTVRGDLRLLIQNGMGRYTVFITEIGVAAALALVLAFAGEILVTLAQTILSQYDQLQVMSLYQMAFNHGASEMGFLQHLLSVAMDLSIFFSAYLMGMLISLVFYRLPKPWKIVVAIGVPAFFFFLLPLLSLTSLGRTVITWIARPIGQIIEFAISGAGNYILMVLIVSMIVAFFCHLLMRRAPIK